MENITEELLNLLKKAKGSRELKELNKLEQDIQSLSLLIKKNLEEDKADPNNSKFLEQLQTIKEVIDDLEKTNNFNNKIFKEFKDFVHARKFK